MKDRMRDLNIKMTELSEYLKVSRPTLYKYIESYESGDLNSIPDKVVSIFKLIDDPNSTKEQVVSFVISAFSGTETSDTRDTVRRYLNDPSASSDKIEMMYRLSTSDSLDPLIPYLNNCMEILSKGSVDEEETYQLARLLIMRSRVTKNAPLKPEELNEAKDILKGLYGR